MEYLVVGMVAALASLLTFFSGFGLGTLLTPAFLWFFPVEVAIAMTGSEHLLNNLFKWWLIGNKANWEVLMRFGLPAILGAFTGAYFLSFFSESTPLHTYQLGERTFEITWLKLLLASLMLAFSLIEILPKFKKKSFEKDKLVYGGLISGFFGGFSGHQGALRSMFLIRFNLEKEVFIATGVLIATFIDITRLSVYYSQFVEAGLFENWPLLLTALLCAFTGAIIGKQSLQKVTIGFVQNTVAIMIMLMVVLLAAGIL